MFFPNGNWVWLSWFFKLPLLAVFAPSDISFHHLYLFLKRKDLPALRQSSVRTLTTLGPGNLALSPSSVLSLLWAFQPLPRPGGFKGPFLETQASGALCGCWANVAVAQSLTLPKQHHSFSCIKIPCNTSFSIIKVMLLTINKFRKLRTN